MNKRLRSKPGPNSLVICKLVGFHRQPASHVVMISSSRDNILSRTKWLVREIMTSVRSFLSVQFGLIFSIHANPTYLQAWSLAPLRTIQQMVVPFQGFFPCIFSQTALGYNELVVITTQLVQAISGQLFWQDNIYRVMLILQKNIFPKIKGLFWQDHVSKNKTQGVEKLIKCPIRNEFIDQQWNFSLQAKVEPHFYG